MDIIDYLTGVSINEIPQESNGKLGLISVLSSLIG